MDPRSEYRKRLACFELIFLEEPLFQTKIDNIWRKRYNRELENMFGDDDVLSILILHYNMY